MSWRALSCYLVKWLIHLKFKYCRHRRCSSSAWPGPGTGCVWYYQAGLRIRLRRMTHASPTHKHPWLRCSRRVHIYFIVISTSWGLHWAQWHHGPGAETDAELNTYLPQHEYLWMLPWLQRSSHLGSGLLQISQWIFGRKFHFQKLQILVLTTCKYYSQKQGHYCIFCNTLDINYFHNCVNILLPNL